MRLLSVRLIVSLIIGITLVSSGFSYYEVLAEKRGLRADVERRDEVLGRKSGRQRVTICGILRKTRRTSDSSCASQLQMHRCPEIQISRSEEWCTT
jgi:hypothetical protein